MAKRIIPCQSCGADAKACYSICRTCRGYVFTSKCPRCGTGEILNAAEFRGKTVRCMYCGCKWVVPEAGAAADQKQTSKPSVATRPGRSKSKTATGGVDELLAMDEGELATQVCIVVDWKDEEEDIVKSFAKRLPKEKLAPLRRGGLLWVRHNGRQHQIPLTDSDRDRYVAISSLANILRAKYEVRILKATLDGDTHALLVLPRATWRKLERKSPKWVRQFRPLTLGKDYFGSGKVPYAGSKGAGGS